MRIDCPFCGLRDLQEFQSLGGMAVRRPDPNAQDSMARFIDYAFYRDNSPGLQVELWQHRSGCRSWLIVRRDTVTNRVEGVELALEAGREQPVVGALRLAAAE